MGFVKKILEGRHSYRLLLSACDLSVFVFLGIISWFLPGVRHIYAYWMVTSVFAWCITYTSGTFWVIDRYSRPVKMVLLSALLTWCASYFLGLENTPFFVLYVMGLTFIWFCYAVLLRLLFRRYHKPVRALVPGDSKQGLFYSKLVNWHLVEDVATVDWALYDCVILEASRQYSDAWKTFFVHAQVLGKPVFTLSEVSEQLQGKVSIEELKHSWEKTSFSTRRTYMHVKRMTDFVGVLLFSPFIVLIVGITALLVRLFMGPNIIFKQKRYGQDNNQFVVYKFRTMKAVRGVKGETQGKKDPRITQFGKFLRKFRLDEFPQFWNVLKGDMSVIGPRPEWKYTANKFRKEIPLYPLRHLVKPGITGWAQINQGHAIGVKGNYEKLQYDIYYVKHFSFGLDCKIFFRTILTILTGHGAK